MMKKNNFPSFRGELPNPGIEPRSLALQADSLPNEPPGKSKNTGVGRLSLLQGIFPTQESNLAPISMSIGFRGQWFFLDSGFPIPGSQL